MESLLMEVNRSQNNNHKIFEFCWTGKKRIEEEMEK
jgi:hypothetical protein